MDDTTKGLTAKGRALPTSHIKMVPIANIVRGKKCDQALNILKVMPQKAAKLLYKLIYSSVHNALYLNPEIDRATLAVDSLTVNQGPARMRIWHRSRGRADRLMRRTTHVDLALKVKKIQKKGKRS